MNQGKIDKIIDQTSRENIPNELPVIPLRSKLLLYPHTVIPIIVGREKSLVALEMSFEKYDRLMLFVAQKKPEEENPKVEDLYKVGTVGRIVQIMKAPENEYRILIEGLKRAKIKKVIESEKLFLFEIELLTSKYKKTKSLEALVRKVKELLEKYLTLTKRLPQEAISAFEETDDPEMISDIIASILPIDLEEKQKLLEEVHPKKRLELELEILTREIEFLELEEKLESKVRKKIEKNQKEYYLKEKLKAIQEELHGEEDVEIKELKEKVEKGNYPEQVKEKAFHEIERLEKMSPYSPEATVVRTYLDWILNLPWNDKTSDRMEISQARKILEKNHYGLEEVKERILEFLAVRQLSQNVSTPILCFVGPPGVGKTSLGRSIAEALGRKFGRMSLGGVRDEAEIRGHRRTYVGALPGRIIQLIRKLKVKNPVIVLDEIDKLGISFQGDPASALLEVLDPEQNKSFVDHYVEIPFDLSEVLFITTANVLHTIPPALQDRMEIIHIPGYTDSEKYQIAKKYLIPKLLKEHGLDKNKFKITSKALKSVISDYTREAGVRNLNRSLAKILRRVALKYLESKEKVEVGVKNLHEFLGAPPYFRSQMLEKPEVGVVTGMAWTAYGGEILNVEVLILSGKGRLITTGQLGDVMKESAKIALSLSRKIVEKYDEKAISKFNECDFHIHVPEGAVPKDGPSAGVTMTTAIVSAVLGKAVRNDVAMTGEITLRGKVLPVGGIKEKVLAAYRAGIKNVILPKFNKKDVEKIPEELKKDLNFIFVENIYEILEKVLV